MENDAIKAKLSEVGVYLRGTPGSRESSVPVQLTTPKGHELDVLGTTPELFGNVDVDELTATLGMDGVMGTPAFAVSSSSSGGSLLGGSSPAGSDPGTWLSRTQEYIAINFILSSVLRSLAPRMKLTSATDSSISAGTTSRWAISPDTTTWIRRTQNLCARTPITVIR